MNDRRTPSARDRRARRVVFTHAMDDAVVPAVDAGPSRFLNREVSWLEFNERVLALAADPQAPLLERAKFLAIFASNLDEFFMVRVAGLIRRLETGLGVRSADGLSTRAQLELIRDRARALAQQHAHVVPRRRTPGAGRRGHHGAQLE